MQKAAELVLKGAKLIGTNADMTDPSEQGIIPATGALIAPIELTTNCKAYFLGKPNPLMMRTALKILESRREDTAIIGDRMETDIIAGIESEITTVLVLSGVSTEKSLKKFAYSPNYILDGVGNIPPEKE
jgi:NagD protein